MRWELVVAESVAAGGPVDVRTVAAQHGFVARSVLRRADREGWFRLFQVSSLRLAPAWTVVLGPRLRPCTLQDRPEIHSAIWLR